jgi:hypothetical protein
MVPQVGRSKKMTTQHQKTPEEETFDRLIEDNWETLSEAARTIIKIAASIADDQHMVHNVYTEWECYDDVMLKMRRAVDELTEQEHKILVQVWCAALAAASSIDPEDFETLAGHKVYRANLHGYYRTASGLIEMILREKRSAQKYAEHQQWLAERRDRSR